MKPIGGGNERFVATMRYPINPLFKLDFDVLYRWIIDKRPSLKGKPFNVYTDDEVVKVLHFNQSLEQIMKYE